jgi:hypothetical protein
MGFGFKIIRVIYNTLLEANTVVWGVVQGVLKVGTIVKTVLSTADVVIGTSHAL